MVIFSYDQLEMCICAAKNSDFALVDGAVVIDLSDLNTVTVDVEGKVCSISFYTFIGICTCKQNRWHNFISTHVVCMVSKY